MAHFIASDVEFLVEEYNLSGDFNKHALSYEANVLDDSTFGVGGTRSHRAGLKAWGGVHNGFIDTAQTYGGNTIALDEIQFERLGRATSINLGLVPEGIVEGNAAYFGKAVSVTYNLTGQIGEMAGFESTYQSSNPLIRGKVLQQDDSETGTGTSSEQLLGALTASTNFLYGALFVTAFDGTDITIKIQSDTTGFPSPTDRITFTTVTAPTSEILTVAGPVTDTYWRAQFSGTFTSCTFTVLAGILP